MFSFIGNFFKGRKEEPVAARPAIKPAVTKGIKYDPSLIKDLKDDHSDLVALYGEIWSEGYQKQDYAKMATSLAHFKSDFQAHLLTENVKFYVYLEQSLANDPHNLALVKEFRTDMNDIANAVVKFCKSYQGNLDNAKLEKFKADYQAVGEVLTRRVSLEEKSLYVLYQQS